MWYRRKASPRTIKVTLIVWGALVFAMFSGLPWRGRARDPWRDAGPPGPPTQTAATSVTSTPISPCAWIPPSEVAAIVGPLESAAGPPLVRVHSVERPRPDSAGVACAYRLAQQADGREGTVVVEVVLDGAAQFESVSGAMGARLVREIDDEAMPMRSATRPVARRDSASGWDYEGGLPLLYVARVGHVGVRVGAQTLAIPRSALAAVAARVRDRIPDRPFVAEKDAELAAVMAAAGDTAPEVPSGPDPCSLLTRTDVESVLGPLAVAPYRSRSATALAESSGQGCTYYTARHRALVLEPKWSSGRMLFGMAKGLGAATSALVTPNEPTDTLVGPWDERAASAMTGDLYFLKGDRMLHVVYRTSSTDLGGAMRLARVAVGRL